MKQKLIQFAIASCLFLIVGYALGNFLPLRNSNGTVPEVPVDEKNIITTQDATTPDGNESAPSDLPIGQIEWSEENFDYGKIPQAVPAPHRFTFKNTGTVPVKIDNVKQSCGCTIPTWSKEEIPPGESGFVDAVFNAQAAGVFKKSLTVTANTEPRSKVLNISGEVIEKK